MKRSMLVGLLVLAALTAVSCSKGGQARAQDPSVNKLTVWTWDPNFNVYAIKKAAEIYAKTHPGFTVEVTEVLADDIETRLTTIASAGDLASLPDVFLMQDNSFKKYVTWYPELFVKTEDSGIDFSQFAPSKVAYSTIDNVHYGIPFDNGAVINCVRTDYLEKAGLTPADFTDITWDEYIEKAKLVRDRAGVPMMTAQAGSPDLILMMLYSAGAALFNDDGSLHISDNEVLKKCMDIYVRMIREKVLVEVTDWDQYIASINNGTTASAMQGCWILASVIAQPSQSGSWTVVNMPRLPDVEGATNYSANGGSSWAVSSNCANVDLAFDFFKSTFAGSTELYDDLIQKGALATWEPAGDSSVYNQPVEFFGGEEVYALIVDYASRTPSFATSPFHYDARDAVGVALSNIIQRGANIDAELKNAQSTVQFNMEG